MARPGGRAVVWRVVLRGWCPDTPPSQPFIVLLLTTDGFCDVNRRLLVAVLTGRGEQCHSSK